MRAKLAILFAVLATAVGALALPSGATATQFPSPNIACNWSTAGGIWRVSNAYGWYYLYYGHTILWGHYYRTFAVENASWTWGDTAYVYCG